MPYLGEATLSDVLDTASLGSRMPCQATTILAIARRFTRLNVIPEAAAVADLRLVRSDYIGGVVHLMAQLSAALDHAHRRGILHRDLKPSNILLAPSGHPMLLDFNLASDTERDAVRLGGTLPYMSPEQLRATVLQPDPDAPADARWDIFSLGVIMYELLTGRLPFGEAATEELPEKSARMILAFQHRGCPALRSFNSAVPRTAPMLFSSTPSVSLLTTRAPARTLSRALPTGPCWRNMARAPLPILSKPLDSDLATGLSTTWPQKSRRPAIPHLIRPNVCATVSSEHSTPGNPVRTFLAIRS